MATRSPIRRPALTSDGTSIPSASGAIDAFRTVRADACVLGVCAFDPEVGVTTSNDDEAQVKRAMIACSDQVVALATRDKLHASSPWVVASLDQIDYLVTDGGKDLTSAFAAAGVSVVAL